MKKLFPYKPRATKGRRIQRTDIPFPYDYKRVCVRPGVYATVEGEVTPDLMSALEFLADQAMKRDQYQADQL